MAAILTIAKDYEIRLSRFSDHSRVSLISYPEMTLECIRIAPEADDTPVSTELMDSEDVQRNFHDAKQFLDGWRELIQDY